MTTDKQVMRGVGPRGAPALVLDFPSQLNWRRRLHFFDKEFQFIDQVLRGITGLPLSSYYVTYAIPYVPQADKPTREDIDENHPRLLEELKNQGCSKILLMGSYAYATLLGQGVQPLNTTRGRGFLTEFQDRNVYTLITLPVYYMTTGETGADNYKDFIRDISKFHQNNTPYVTPKLDVFRPKDLQGLIQSLNQLLSASALSCDTETTGLDPMVDTLDAIGFGALYKSGTGVLVVIVDRELLWVKGVVETLINFFKAYKNTFIFHNAKFDLEFLVKYLKWDIHLHINFTDTMLMNYLVDERPLNNAAKPHGLKALTRVRYDLTDYKFDFKAFWAIPVEERDWESFYYYLGQDLMYTLLLYKDLSIELPEDNPKALNVLNTLLIPALRAFVDIELEGIKIDIPYLSVVREEVETRLEGLYQKMQDLLMTVVPREEEVLEWVANYNPNSPPQSILAIYTYLGAKPIGKPSTDKTILFSVMEAHRGTPIETFCNLLLEYREYSKVLNTYVVGLTNQVHVDGRIRSQFNLNGTATGRLSSSSPNLQNIPTMMGPLLRKAFIPKDGCFLAEVDYSQLELRIAAWYSQDPIMLRAYQDNRDIHKEVASAAFGVPYDEVTYHQRYSAKLIGFGMIYGRGAESLAVGSKHEHYHWTVAEAQKFMDDFLGEFVGLKDWIEGQHNFVRTHHYIEQPTGRRRRWPFFPPGTLNQIYRQSVNSPIQGLASDFTLTTIINFHKWFREEKLETRMVSTVHDSILLEIPYAEVDYVLEKGMRIMATQLPVQCNIPIQVDGEVGLSWGDLEKWEKGKIQLGMTRDGVVHIWEDGLNLVGPYKPNHLLYMYRRDLDLDLGDE